MNSWIGWIGYVMGYHDITIWCGIVWYGMVWYGMVWWYGVVVWCGGVVVWYVIPPNIPEI
jgi:hypothetical protein